MRSMFVFVSLVGCVAACARHESSQTETPVVPIAPSAAAAQVVTFHPAATLDHMDTRAPVPLSALTTIDPRCCQ